MNKAVSIESLHRVQDARHLSNPTRDERSECRVGYAAGARGCVSETHYYHHRWTSSASTRIVACLLHAGTRTAPATPHCAPLRSAYAGLLRFRASGTRRKSPDYLCIRGNKKIHEFLTGIILLLAFSFTGCRNSSAQADETNEIQIMGPADTLANIPMTVKFMSIYIPCTINGKTKLFILDPEWKYNCIEKRYISELYDTTGTLHTSFKDGFSTVLSIHTLQYSIGNQNFTLDTSQVISHNDSDGYGIVGKPLFNERVVCINFDEKEMYITNKVPDSIPDYIQKEYTINKEGHSVIAVNFPTSKGDKNCNLIVDFGAPTSNLDNDLKEIITINGNKPNPTDIAQMLIAFCNSIRNRNQTHWTNTQTGQPDDPYKRWGCDGSIGFDIISLYNWIIDYRNNKIYYTPNEHYKKMTKQ